jgi:hypothetical protein
MSLKQEIGTCIRHDDARRTAIGAQIWRPIASFRSPFNQATCLFIPSPEKIFKIVGTFLTSGCLHISVRSNAGDVISIPGVNPDCISFIDE